MKRKQGAYPLRNLDRRDPSRPPIFAPDDDFTVPLRSAPGEAAKLDCGTSDVNRQPMTVLSQADNDQVLLLFFIAHAPIEARNSGLRAMMLLSQRRHLLAVFNVSVDALLEVLSAPDIFSNVPIR